ncbi:hypothetical protein BZA05DRAFT_450897 [Tricharina praecox]|uniref:uncharacterized protein n=1 Tax=Tricharina praecox TaxID=43433 RepID=UPI00222005C5|nr:uncharacterized protein BZA05DRAFT_450897 [Tricharina praecox]KAI5858936.1 hypothetical protein BZA05DRAFT_450897 [Tricharina praecox]
MAARAGGAGRRRGGGGIGGRSGFPPVPGPIVGMLTVTVTLTLTLWGGCGPAGTANRCTTCTGPYCFPLLLSPWLAAGCWWRSNFELECAEDFGFLKAGAAPYSSERWSSILWVDVHCTLAEGKQWALGRHAGAIATSPVPTSACLPGDLPESFPLGIRSLRQPDWWRRWLAITVWAYHTLHKKGFVYRNKRRRRGLLDT